MTAQKKRILIVEDQSDNLQIFEWSLRKGGYAIEVAQGARQALRKIASEHFDLILTDLAMPQMSGVELIEAVRNIPEKSRVTIVAITAFAWDSIAMEARKAGCDGFIHKPIQGKELLREVEKYLRGWRFSDGFELQT